MFAAVSYQKAPEGTARASARPVSGDNPAREGPRRRRGGALMMLFGLMGAAAAWVLQTEIGETLAAQACFPHRSALAAPQWSWLMPALDAISVVALLIGVAGVWAAWRGWRSAARPDPASPASDASVGRTRFLALAGIILSLLFVVGLVATGLAVLLVSPCSAWR
ncbi:hypothetical protein [Paraburkholderia aromaticivorans]|uniref:Cytochrome C oxidase subunit I n=1 Tax=Paraburkholderia aromaticivorans TaxID=2026199 RepID=A0A248VVU9_9BURK|nr:hypothetical protein [Paraburkholderia aromaticivorans]ASW03128.1 hypothetical protein CJU94_33400 [Paraburkholderia aromaticivorans]